LGRDRVVIRAYLAAAGLAGLLLFAPLVARAAPTDKFVAGISPSATQPPGLGTYVVGITNLPSSPDAATQGTVSIPAGVTVDGLVNPPQAAIVSGPCTGSWTVTLSSASIDLAAPNAGSALCAGGTLAVTLSVLTTPPGDGSYVWTTSLSGSAGSFTAQGQPTLVLDGTAPETGIQGTPPVLTGPTASFAFSGSDPGGSGVASFQCSVDGGGFAPCTSPKSYTLPSGAHTFAVRAVDRAGNVDPTPDSVAWTVDATPPETTIQGQPPAFTNASAAFAFAGNDDSGVAGFQCSLDGAAFTPCANPAGYSGLGDGEHTFEVRAIDLVGNIDPTPASFTWHADTVPPETMIASGPMDPSGSSSARFEFGGADGGAGLDHFECALDGGGFAGCSSPATYSDVADGLHLFRVRAVDAVGNRDPTPASFAWTIDTVHPRVTLTDKPPLLTNRTSVSFSFSTQHAGSTFECRLDGAAFASCTSPKPYKDLADGSHTFAVRAVSLGNPGLPTTYSWTVDTLPPQTAIAETPPARSTAPSAKFAFTSSEPGATFACSLDASGFTPCASPKSYAGLGDGQHVFRVQAIDAAGNTDSSPAIYSWQIAGVGPPTADLTPPANVSQLRRNVSYGRLQLRWRKPSDADFDHVAVYVTTSPKSQPRTLLYSGKSQSYTNKRFKNGGYYRYLVVSYDHDQNASRGRSARVPPSALLTSPRDGGIVRSAPVLRWTAVRKATFYNVQVYYRGQKILSSWPAKARRPLARRWAYAGHSFSLRRGTYVWYVWPGFGPRAKSRYGQLLGLGTFKVR
jgi:large repetitive protein